MLQVNGSPSEIRAIENVKTKVNNHADDSCDWQQEAVGAPRTRGAQSATLRPVCVRAASLHSCSCEQVLEATLRGVGATLGATLAAIQPRCFLNADNNLGCVNRHAGDEAQARRDGRPHPELVAARAALLGLLSGRLSLKVIRWS